MQNEVVLAGEDAGHVEEATEPADLSVFGVGLDDGLKGHFWVLVSVVFAEEVS